jgi:hypothetical protein
VLAAACCQSQIARKTVEACRSYLELPHFNKEVIYNKSRAAAGLCEWAINIVKYYDVVSEVEPKRQELAAANATLQEANTTLAAVQQKVGCCFRSCVPKAGQHSSSGCARVLIHYCLWLLLFVIHVKNGGCVADAT